MSTKKQQDQDAIVALQRAHGACLQSDDYGIFVVSQASDADGTQEATDTHVFTDTSYTLAEARTFVEGLRGKEGVLVLEENKLEWHNNLPRIWNATDNDEEICWTITKIKLPH